MNDRNEVSRRRVLQIGGAAAVAAAAAPALGGETAAVAAAKPGNGPGGHGGFARPAAAVRPRFRWWWPDAHVDPAEIRREIDQIADAGFGGAEIVALHHSIDDKSLLDPKKYGWGTEAWNEAVEAALDQARRRGVTVDLTMGPAWPAAVPSITPDDEAAVQELAYGATTVRAGATHDGPVPEPVAAPADGVTKRHLVAVHAVRLDPANDTRKETGLAPASFQDLTAKAANGRIAWTAPSDGDWVLLSYWRRGSGQRPESGPHSDPPSTVVDHFSKAGTRAVTAFWEARLLTPRIRKLIRQAGWTLFEDSIELETDALNWTPGLPEEFRKRRGYDLMPYLPVIVRHHEDTIYTYDAATTSHVRHDFWLTISDLFAENHFEAIAKWAHSIGLEYRAQPYGLETDSMQAAAILDVPEGESLGFKNLDDYRALAGGRDMAGREVLSCEAGAYQGGAYNTTWEKLLLTMGGAYAAGLNQTVLHGFSYATAPGANWPGFAGFTPYSGNIGYSESWGPRQPTWRHVPDVAAYMSRIHHTMRTGTSRIDVAVFRQKGYTKTGIGAGWFTKDGIPLGWTHQFISAPLLDLRSATVRNGRLAPDGPAYKVVFVEGDRFAGKECTLPLDSARTMLKLTKAGLPLVFLGDWSAATVPGLERDGENAKLRAVLKELFAQPRVRVVAAEADVPGALADLGVTPAVSYAQSSTLLVAHREDRRADYYYLVNGKHADQVKPPIAPIDHEVTFTRSDRRAVPYRLDLWTGEERRVAVFKEDGDKVTLRIALQPGEAVVIKLAHGGNAPHATASDAELRVERNRLVARATAAGTYATTLPNGRTVRTEIRRVPEARELTSWRLRVEDMTPDGVKRHDLRLDALKPWPQIPELADVSGIGTYSTTVEWDGRDGAAGAVLDLGSVFDTCRVTVNGRRLPAVSVLVPKIDVGPYLRRGRNTIEVEVATTLNNRLRVADPGVYGNARPQDYGLIGPVRLVPYAEEDVRTR
ncbi:glycosyl hydrolase [Spirillospora sp. NPDC052242]